MERNDYLWAASACILLAGYLALCLTTLATTAPTFDEVAHLPAGYASLVSGHQVLNPEHPPLAKKLAALGLLAVVQPTSRLEQAWSRMDEWEFGRYFLFQGVHDPQRLMAAGRIPMVALGLLGCLVVLWWSRERHGWPGALTSLALCSLSPTILAHARLVTTDVPVAAFGTLAAYLAWRHARQPRLNTAVAAGLALGAAMATKFTGILFAPSLLLAAILAKVVQRRRLERTRHGREERLARGGPASSSTGGPEGRSSPRAAPADSRGSHGSSLAALADGSAATGCDGPMSTARDLAACWGAAVAVVAMSYGWPPQMEDYLAGFSSVGFNHTPGYEFYLLGRFSAEGFMAYFPVALLLKSSPVLLVVLALQLALPLARRVRQGSRVPAVYSRVEDVPSWPFLALPALVYFVFIVLEAPEIGVRYAIPVLPFLFIGAGAVGEALWRVKAGRVLLAILAAWQCHVAMTAWPDPISYFNGLWGCGDTNAIACLDDSNLDWGQDLVSISRVLETLRDPNETVRLLYFGTADPRAYLRHFRAMRPEELLEPAQALYVVSVHRLHRVIHDTGVDWFSRYTPVARVGRTCLVYDFRAGRRAGRGTPLQEEPGERGGGL